MKQLSFIQEPKQEALERDLIKLKDQCERMRKAQFAKISALTKVINELSFQLDALNKAICKNQPKEWPPFFNNY